MKYYDEVDLVVVIGKGQCKYLCMCEYNFKCMVKINLDIKMIVFFFICYKIVKLKE